MSVAESQESRDVLASLRIPRRDEPRKPSVVKRLIQWLVVLAFLAGIGGGGFLLAQQRGWLDGISGLVPDAIRSLPEVSVSKVTVEKGRSADAVVVAAGYLESRRQAKIGARAAGRIQVVNVEEGTRVKVDEVIAVLEHRDIDAALAATKATAERAQAELAEQEVEIARTKSLFERARRLYKTKAITDEEFEQARFQHEGAVARRDSLQAAKALAAARVHESEQFKENMIVRAPFDGTVISKDAEVGESILPGGMGEASGRGSVVTIADLDHLEVDCDVKEDYISRVTQGVPAEVAVDAVPERRYRGRVRKIIPMGDRARATIKVKVEILDADERLFPDMSSTVYILPNNSEDSPVDEKPRLFCESSAVLTADNGPIVWLLNKQNRAEKVAVTIGRERDGRTEITSGLSGGERVIVNPPATLEAGAQLKLRE